MITKFFVSVAWIVYFQINHCNTAPSSQNEHELINEFLQNHTSLLTPLVETENDFQEPKLEDLEVATNSNSRRKIGFNRKETTCQCTKFFQCDVDNGTSIEGADVDVIDIRVEKKSSRSECDHYLDICCNKLQIKGSDQEKNFHVSTLVTDNCGIRNLRGVGFRIIGDVNGESQFGEFPWMAAITRIGDQKHTNVYLCGGSLIHPKVILTAAHCVDKYDASKLQVRLGEWDTQTDGELFPSQDRQVEKVELHPNYTAKKFLMNDIALLFLDKSAQLGPNVAPICLAPEGVNFEGKRCLVSGWGKDSYEQDGAYQVIMKRVEVPVVSRSSCQSALRGARLGNSFHLHESFVCAGGELGRDSCKGDGGSPLVCKLPNSNSYVQYGIVSWGLSCGQDKVPGVYANVPKYFSWIQQKMAEARLDPKSYLSYLPK